MDLVFKTCIECDWKNENDKKQLKQFANEGFTIAQIYYADGCLRIEKKPRKAAVYYLLASKESADIYSFIIGLNNGTIILDPKTPINEALDLLSAVL
jgi:hypothetical protein